MRIIRVVVVDDSAYNRRTITKMLEAMNNVQVVGYAVDGEDGIRKVMDLKPDLITLDLEMPRMDGFTMLRIIMKTSPTPVIVISCKSEDERVFKALELGAVDFIAKPTPRISEELLKITDDLQETIRNVFLLNMSGITGREMPAPFDLSAGKGKPVAVPGVTSALNVIAVGASTGGPPALQAILSALPAETPFTIAISQHMPPGFTRTFAERLNRLSTIEVKEACDGDLLVPGRALIAPGGKNLLFRQTNGGTVCAKVVEPAPQDRYVPSVDAMFSSLAHISGPSLLAVVLTGMGNDGSQGIKAVKEAGGGVIAESEKSAIIFGMPREAIATGMVDKVVDLEGMAREFMSRCG